MRNKLKDRIRLLRKEKGLSQSQVADALNITRGSYSNYENGYREPDSNTLIKLAEFFGETSDYLLGLTDENNL